MTKWSFLAVPLLFVSVAGAEVAQVQNSVVFSDPQMFCGWPANEGFWQWGDEMLVAFNVTEYEEQEGHNVAENAYQWINFARSLDGGETWTVEAHPEVSTPGIFNGPNYVKAPGYPTIPAAVLSPGGFDFTAEGFALKARNGSFQVSDDKGATWSVPYDLPNFGQTYMRARTNYIVHDSQTMTLFVEATNYPPTSGEYMRTMVVQTSDGGQSFQQLGWLTPDPLQGQPITSLPAYALMPGVAKLEDGTMLAAVRNRLSGSHWNDVVASTDGGNTWDTISTPVVGNNNPASLVPLGGQRLGLVYGSRQAPYGLRGKISEDGGQTWSQEYILRDDGREWDLGYVRAGLRSDGNITAVYYYTTDAVQPNFIASTVWDVPKTSHDAIGTWYNFNESAGPVLNDSIGSAHGTTQDVVFNTSGVDTDRGNAGHFNGTTSNVTFGTSGHPDAFDLWAKITSRSQAG
ncbi:MAG: sialidase family protein [Phycisphaerales bacterium]